MGEEGRGSKGAPTKMIQARKEEKRGGRGDVQTNNRSDESRKPLLPFLPIREGGGRRDKIPYKFHIMRGGEKKEIGYACRILRSGKGKRKKGGGCPQPFTTSHLRRASPEKKNLKRVFGDLVHKREKKKKKKKKGRIDLS